MIRPRIDKLESRARHVSNRKRYGKLKSKLNSNVGEETYLESINADIVPVVDVGIDV